MSFKYESPEFSDELKKRINANVEYREKAKGMNWKTLVIVKELPFATFSKFENGEFIERKHVPSSEIEEHRKISDFVVEIPTYELSVEVVTGRKSLESLYFNKIVKLDGSLFKALQYRGVMEMVSKITAELVKDSVIPSKEEFAEMLRKRGLL